MNWSKSIVCSWMAAAAVACSAGPVSAQWSLEGDSVSNPARAEWRQRVLRNTNASQGSPAATATADFGANPVRPQRSMNTPRSGGTSATYASHRVAERGPSHVLSTEPLPMESTEPFHGETLMSGEVIGGDCQSCGVGGGCSDCTDCGGCGTCDECISCCDPCCGFGGYFFRNVAIFAGVHGFKGPVDQGRNGNFGFQEGLNFGAPLGDPWGMGYQLGFQAVQSNFAGDQADGDRRGDRDQIFFTGGIFHRAMCGGIQWGVVYDVQHDIYYNRTDLKQIRSETSLILPYGNEIGYFGAYGTGGDELILLDRTELGLQPTDMFCAFYRRQFENGGEGRIWGGITGHGDGLVGAEFNVPLGRSFALENRINYLIPKQGPNSSGQREESWGLVAQLVWYPGRPAICALQNPFRPLFNVADNATFMADFGTVEVEPNEAE